MKKMRLLSSMVAIFMVFSMLTVMPAGAAQTGMEPFFCDFEDFNSGALTEAGCTQNGFIWVNNPSNGFIGTDATYGNGLGVTNAFALGFGLDTPITTGKARIGFSFKAGSWGYLQLLNETGTSYTNSTKNIGSLLNFGANGVTIMDGSGNGLSGGTKTVVADTWYYVECVVDVDTNTWTLYVDGTKVKDYTLPEASEDKIPKVAGFAFYNGSERKTCGLIDNVALSVEQDTMQVISTNVDDEKITVVFSEMLADDITTDDITITECGGTNTIGVSSVDVLVNKMVITYDGTFEAGKEYAVSFSDNVKSQSGKKAEGETYVYLPLGSSEMGRVDYDFEDLTATPTANATGTITRQLVNEQYAKDILSYTSYYASPSTNLAYAVVENVDPLKVGNTSASGKALGAYIQANMRLLDVIDTDEGIETYEFDFFNNFAFTLKHSSGASTSSGTQTTVSPTIAASNTWRHMTIVYDTSKDELSVYIDNELKQTTPIDNLDHPLYFNHASSGIGFIMDNYTSYTTVTPLNVEKVRYTDAAGKVTGANIINPETTQIDITFSADVSDADVADISLTANGADIDFEEPVIDGNVVTLNIRMLPGGADIKLQIPSADRVYNVKTAAGRFEISNLSLTVNGSEVVSEGTTGPSGDTVVITADVINTAGKGKKLTVIYAFYNDCELVDINVAEVIIENDEYVKQIETDPITTKANVEYDSVKAFIWNSLGTANSQTAAVSYPAE